MREQKQLAGGEGKRSIGRVLTELRLRNFRCFESLVFQPKSGVHFLVGRNAEGKTSILEAACALARLQSPRAASLGQTIQFDCPAASLDGRIHDRHLRFQWGQGGRKVELDSVVQPTSSEYLGVAKVSWFSNDDMELLRGGGGPRRRFLDFLGAQTVPGYLTTLRDYDRALRSRNLLLRQGASWAQIEAYHQPMGRLGDFLTSARRELLRELSPQVQQASDRISGCHDATDCEFEASIDQPLLEALGQTRSRDERLRQTTSGPHRDDFCVRLNGRNAAQFASEGQQRTAVLALRVAQTHVLHQRTGQLPLLLIDDVFGELDEQRRNHLLASLPPGAQSLITTTHLSWKTSDFPAYISELNDGKLTPLQGV